MTAHQQSLLGPPPRPTRVILRSPGQLLVIVHGHPVAQGSKRIVTGRGGAGRPHMIDNNDRRLRPWRDNLRAAASDALDDWERPRFARAIPVELIVTFTFPRPASHYGTGRNAGVLKAGAPDHVTTIPDLDKLLRSLDSLTDAGVWDDDRQVTTVTACKVYTGAPHQDALDVPGAVIRVRAVRVP